MVGNGASTGFVGSEGLSGGVVGRLGKGRMGPVHTSQLCQEPSNPRAGVSLRTQEVREHPEEITSQEES